MKQRKFTLFLIRINLIKLMIIMNDINFLVKELDCINNNSSNVIVNVFKKIYLIIIEKLKFNIYSF